MANVQWGYMGSNCACHSLRVPNMYYGLPLTGRSSLQLPMEV
jgi:hypothetical protein